MTTSERLQSHSGNPLSRPRRIKPAQTERSSQSLPAALQLCAATEACKPHERLDRSPLTICVTHRPSYQRTAARPLLLVLRVTLRVLFPGVVRMPVLRASMGSRDAARQDGYRPALSPVAAPTRGAASGTHGSRTGSVVSWRVEALTGEANLSHLAANRAATTSRV